MEKPNDIIVDIFAFSQVAEQSLSNVGHVNKANAQASVPRQDALFIVQYTNCRPINEITGK